jgi:hypothetical protein
MATIHKGCPLCEAMQEALEEGTMHAPMYASDMGRPGSAWRSLPANMPVPPAQSPSLQNVGLATQVRAYPEVPEVRPLEISGRVR